MANNELRIANSELKKRSFFVFLLFSSLFVSFYSLFLSGCAAPATVHVIPLSLNRVNVNQPLMVTVEPTACYWWLNEGNELCIAMTARSGALGGPLRRREFDLSIILDGLPAGSSRAYAADFHTARGRARNGLSHTRFASWSGSVAIWDFDPTGRRPLKGRLRFQGVQQSFFILTGWGKDASILVLADFTARHDAARGQAIMSRTEHGITAQSPP